MTARRRPTPATVALALALAVALGACETEIPVDDRGATAAGVGSAASSDAAASASTAPAPSGTPSALVFGPFRRGGVPAPGDVLQAAEAQCRKTPVPTWAEEIGSRRMVVSDLRGLGVLILVFADGQGGTGCRVEVAQGGAMRASFFRLRGRFGTALGPTDLTLDAMEYQEVPDGQRAIAVGRAGERAVHVRAGFDDDTYVTATLHEGWYAMWWPTLTRPAVIVAGNNRNEAIATVDAP